MGEPLNRGETLRILQVEDNPRDARLCTRHLEQAGFNLQVDIVSSAEEFLQALRSTPYDIILADYRMPNWSGIDALETLQGEGKDIPFILVTGTIGEEKAVECIKKGATDYILKDRLGRLAIAVNRAMQDKLARAEREKVEKSRDLLVSIVESSDDAVVAVAPDGAILSWNHGATRIYEYAAEEIQGKMISVLFAPDAIEEFHAAMASIQRDKSVGRYETRGTKKSGALIDVAVTMSPIRDSSGDLEGASVIIRDITEQKRLQTEFLLSQKMEAIGRLAAGVAHDFNNLLTVITGYSSLLLEQLSEHDPLHTEVREIHKAGQRAAGLTRQLLAFSRKQILQPQVVGLNKIVADMDRMLRRLIGEDIDLVTVLDPRLGLVKADPGQMEQVIMNLAVNAREAMPKGGKLTIETVNVDLHETVVRRHAKILPGSYAMMAITDTGIGMDMETQARIFEPFFTTKGDGTGLGLSTVYGIVEQSGGTVIVYSEPGHGTTFKIYLPRIQEPAWAEAAVIVSPPKGSETILVVEDEDAVRSLICGILQKQGYTLLRAKNGGEALLVCEQHNGKIDLMITDVIMPAMSGSELAVRLESVRPEMKVLFMSGYTDNAIVHHGVLNANIAFLEKPFAPSVLARKVRERLDADEG